MRARFGVLTLGVDDLKKSLKFTAMGFGLRTEGIVGQQFEHGSVAMFHLEGGSILSLYPRSDLGLDAGNRPDAAQSHRIQHRSQHVQRSRS